VEVCPSFGLGLFWVNVNYELNDDEWFGGSWLCLR
jgi:hypothetical protein